MRCLRWTAIAVCLLGLVAVPAIAGETASLDRVAIAVDGAESSHGSDPAMWRADPAGPQGPMQVSAAAASDVGGGDRFDTAQNRALGRAYLAQLHARYGNWPDAIAAYNWGIGNMDAWLKAGRPDNQLLTGVAAISAAFCTTAASARLAPRGPHRCAGPASISRRSARAAPAGARLGSCENSIWRWCWPAPQPQSSGERPRLLHQKRQAVVKQDRQAKSDIPHQ